MDNSAKSQTDSSIELMAVDAARATMLRAVGPLATEWQPLERAQGRILAQDVVALHDTPPFDVSAMDGYALRGADTPGKLALMGISAAGHGFDGTILPGRAVRVSTGAPMPAGADTVVIQENVVREGSDIVVHLAEPGAHIRRQGSVLRAGTTLLKTGQRLDAAELALAAAAGCSDLQVRCRPHVAILSSGDELAAPGTPVERWQIYDSNSYGVAALARCWGAEAHRLATARDDVNAISMAAARGLAECDFLVLVGGASAGDHDVARPALARLGLEMTCASVAMRPGKPVWFGTTPHGAVLGLPGNPVAAFVCAHLFLRPLIYGMLGYNRAVPPLLAARLSHSLPANGEREYYALAELTVDHDGILTVRVFEKQDSSLVSACALANVLVRRLPFSTSLDSGAIVEVVPLGPPETPLHLLEGRFDRF